jgi:hypothetical protein
MKINQIPNFTRKERDAIGMAYVRQIEQVIDERSDLQDNWRKALENYEGKPPERTWPWKHASNAFLPITSTHSDAIYARLYNTSTGQDPIYLVNVIGAADTAGFTGDEFTALWQQLSKYIEASELRVKDIMALSLLITVKYGDSIVYIPWRSEQVKDYDLDHDTGEWAEVEARELFGRPDPKVIHPENFFIPIHSHGPQAIQEAPWCAYEYTAGYDQIELWKQMEFWNSDEANDLQKMLRPDEIPDRSEAGHYFPDMGDSESAPLGRDRLKEYQRDQVGLDREITTDTLRMYHVWARVDTDGDGIAEEINFHVHAKTGYVTHISWNPYKHRKRPFVRIQYNERDGIFYSIGVPEMLFNIQDILNQTMRDIMDNNKVQNTKAFLAKKNAGIDPKLRVYPSRIIFVDDVADFVPIDLGSGKPITSVQDLLLMQQWGERRTGISDFNLGQENTKRTPATSVLSRLEQSNIRIDLVVRRLREAQDDMWDQVLSLYAQFGFTEESLDSLLGADAVQFEAAVREMSVEDIRKNLKFQAQTSTQNLNRSVKREEALTLFGTLQGFYEQINNLALLMSQSPDPTFRTLFEAMAQGYHKSLARFLATFDGINMDELNPDLTPILTQLLGGTPDALSANQGQANGSGSPVEQVANGIGGAPGAPGPINPIGRPAAGLPSAP